MKKVALFALLLSMGAVSSALAAGGAFGVSGGMAKGTGDLGEATRMGFQAGAFGEYAINEQFAVGVGADYLKMNASDDYKTALGEAASDLAGVPVTADDVSFAIIPITAYGRWMPAMQGSVAPYVLAGGGLYVYMPDATLSAGGIEVSGAETIRKPGFFAGAGVDYKVNPSIRIGVFGKFHDIFTEGSSTMFFHGGLNASFGVASR